MIHQTPVLPFTMQDGNGNREGQKGSGKEFTRAATIDWVAKGEFLQDGVIGEAPTGFMRYMFNIDPFKPTSYIRNANEFTPKNMFFALIYWAFLVIYGVTSIQRHFDRPWVESFGNTAMDETPPVALVVKLQCSTPFGCYRASPNATLPIDWAAAGAAGISAPIEWVQVRQKYTSLREGYCADAVTENTTVVERSAVAEVPITMCRSSDSSNGVDVSIPFPTDYEAAGAPSMNVVVESLEPGGMSVEVSMEASQVKTVFVGKDVLRKSGEPESSDIYNADLFYNSKKPFNTATLRVRLTPRAGIRTIERPGSLLDVLANVGGASGFLLAVLTALRGLDFSACSRKSQGGN